MILISKLFLSHRYVKYFFILFFSLLLNCENTNRADNKGKEVVNNNDSGVFTDSRDNQSYNWVRLKDGKKWMTENLNYKTTDSWHYQNSSDYAKYGRLYTWQAAKKACPSGWRLPTDDEWWKMASYYGKAYSSSKNNTGDNVGKAAYKALMKGGSSGFSALLGGYRRSHGDFYSLDRYGNGVVRSRVLPTHGTTTSAATTSASTVTTAKRVWVGRVVAFRTNSTICQFDYF